MEQFGYLSTAETAELAKNNAVIVDIRDADSFAQGHMPGAVHLDNHSVAAFIQQADLDAPTVVVCYHGHASQSAAAYLHSQGFDQVYSMNGGFADWSLQFPDQIEHDSQE